MLVGLVLESDQQQKRLLLTLSMLTFGLNPLASQTGALKLCPTEPSVLVTTQCADQLTVLVHSLVSRDLLKLAIGLIIKSSNLLPTVYEQTK